MGFKSSFAFCQPGLRIDWLVSRLCRWLRISGCGVAGILHSILRRGAGIGNVGVAAVIFPQGVGLIPQFCRCGRIALLSGIIELIGLAVGLPASGKGKGGDNDEGAAHGLAPIEKA
jgi:hypothetical protein